MTFGKVLSALVFVGLAFWFLRPIVVYYSGSYFPPANSILGEWVGTLTIERAVPDTTPHPENEVVIGNAPPPQITRTSGVLYINVTPFTSGQVTGGLYTGEGQLYIAGTGETRNVKNNFYFDSDKATFTYDLDADDIPPHVHFGRMHGTFLPGKLTSIPEAITYSGETDLSFQGSLRKGTINEYSGLVKNLKNEGK